MKAAFYGIGELALAATVGSMARLLSFQVDFPNVVANYVARGLPSLYRLIKFSLLLLLRLLKWSTLCRWHMEMNFLEPKLSYFDYYLNEICLWGSNWDKNTLNADGRLTLNMQGLIRIHDTGITCSTSWIDAHSFHVFCGILHRRFTSFNVDSLALSTVFMFPRSFYNENNQYLWDF